MSLLTKIYTVLNLTEKAYDGHISVERVFTCAVDAYDYIQPKLGSTDTDYPTYKFMLEAENYCIVGKKHNSKDGAFKIQAIEL